MEKELIENAGTAFQETPGPDVKTSLDPGPNKQEVDKVARQSKESNTNTPSEESDGQIRNSDHGEGSDESDEIESDFEVTVLPELQIMVGYWPCDEVEIVFVFGRHAAQTKCQRLSYCGLFRITISTKEINIMKQFKKNHVFLLFHVVLFCFGSFFLQVDNSNPPKDKTVPSVGTKKNPSLSKPTMDRENKKQRGKRKEEERTRQAAQ